MVRCRRHDQSEACEEGAMARRTWGAIRGHQVQDAAAEGPQPSEGLRPHKLGLVWETAKHT
eukprot:4822403-Alexandrium_andersonii.AAC.1